MYTNQVSFIMLAIALASINLAEFQEIQKIQTINYSFNAVVDTTFYLFTPNNNNTPDVIILNDEASLSASNFNNLNPTRVITHGWENDVTSPVNVLIREAYFKKGYFNIISVDWSKGAKNLIYPEAQDDTQQVAEVVATFINFLCEHRNISASSIYLIGHSLGAHISGIAGKILKSDFQKIIHTIYGLDPALPDYYIDDPNTRLASTDAYYVETIQTNCGQLGFVKPLGQASFYPNWGGPRQPGCSLSTVGCSHGRAYEYFAETINTDRFIGHKCANYQEITRLFFKQCTKSGPDAIMGGEPSQTGSLGVFYLPTSSVSPYALGQFPYNTISFF